MANVTPIWDGLKNLVANLGTDRDKASHSYYADTFMSDQQLQTAYRNAWIPRKVVDIVAEDAGRNWRAWKGVDAEEVARIQQVEKELQLQSKVIESLKKARLFGGSAIYISTGEEDVTRPLSGNEKIQRLTVMNARDLSPGENDRDPDSPYYGKPGFYTMPNSALRIHPSRLAIFMGEQILDEEIALGRVGINRGWGDSVLKSLYQAMTQADDTAANVGAMIFEAMIDVIKIKGFMAGLSDPRYEEQVLTRLRLAARAKGVNGTLILDAEEDYDKKSANFTGLKDIWSMALQVVSGASDIPMTRLLGQSPGGLSSTGESDMRNYYDMVSSTQELEITPSLALLDRLLLNNAGVGDKAYYEWKPLWQNTDSEQAELGNQIAETIERLSNTNLFAPDALSASAIALLEERGVMSGLQDATDAPVDPLNEELVPGESEVESLDARVNDMAPRPLYVSRRVVNVEQIVEWFESQGMSVSNDNLHVTVTYSANPVDWMKMGSCYGDRDGMVRVDAGGPRSLEVLSGDLVMEFACEDLNWRHDEMIRKGASWDFPGYVPHITLSYDYQPGVDSAHVEGIEPYRGPILLGPEIFEELKPRAEAIR